MMTEAQRDGERVAVVRFAKFGAFGALGIVLGIVAAVVLTLVGADRSQSVAQPLGILIVVLGIAGGALGLLVAVVVNAILRRRSAHATAKRTLESPKADAPTPVVNHDGGQP